MHDRKSDSLEMPTDLLSNALRDLRPVGVSYGHCLLTRPWGVEVPTESSARLHLVVSGEAWLRPPGQEWVKLTEGDAVFLPRGPNHRLADSPRTPVRPLGELPRETIGERTYRIVQSNVAATTVMACCSVRFAEPVVHPLLALMPAMLLVKRATITDPLLPTLLDAMAEEVLTARVGSSTVLSRLADVVITRLIRSWMETPRDDATGWFAAIRDRKLGRALAALHDRPTHRWSLDSLARVAGVSRSTFAERFVTAVGEPPARYLTRWRMYLAGIWLTEEHATIAQVAARLGYDAEASFSRAFKRVTGISPGQVRTAAVQDQATLFKR
jgi:AraC-like DNA-binding protein